MATLQGPHLIFVGESVHAGDIWGLIAVLLLGLYVHQFDSALLAHTRVHGVSRVDVQ